MKRRTFLKRALQLGVLGTIPLGYAWQIEPFRLEFVKMDMPIENLPTELEGKILMQISDLHVGNRFDWRFLIDSFIKAKKFNPDFVVYTGDFVNKGTTKELEYLKAVMEVAVKGTLGTFGVFGNHDYGQNWRNEKAALHLKELLSDFDIQILCNEKVDCHGLQFIGFEDLWSPNFNPQEGMKLYDSSLPAVVLCHNPDVCDLDVWNGYKGWVLSGHTHGGQCRIPGFRAPLLPIKNKNYAAGKVNLKDGRTLYVNRALGHSYQVRFMVRPEITVFKLLRA